MDTPKTELSDTSENRNPKKHLIFQEVTFRGQKIKKNTLKKFLIFLALRLKNFLYFRIEL